MSEKGSQVGGMRRLKLEDLGRKYEAFRFVAPRAEEKLARSLSRHGQLVPITVVEEEGVYQVLDGFKRVRAAEGIPGLASLEAKCSLPGAGKAMVLRLNLDRKGLDPVEEGLLMQAMHREDGLAQSEIAGLIGRHRSWVCRRIALVERLDGKVVENLRLGLITPSQGRSLALLPRGNQQDVLAETLEGGLTSRETARLVMALKLGGVYDVPQIKAEADKVRAPKPSGDRETTGKGEPMTRLLSSMKVRCGAVTDYLEAHPQWRPRHAKEITAAREAAAWAVEQLDERLEEMSHA